MHTTASPDTIASLLTPLLKEALGRMRLKTRELGKLDLE